MTHGPIPTRFPQSLPSPVPPHRLDARMTPARADLYRQVLARRSRRLVVVVEDCFDPHNATAIVRTCDAFGVHCVHVVTARNHFKLNPKVCQGSHLYMDVRIHAEIGACYAALRSDGYRILVTDLRAGAAVGPSALAPMLAEQPLALVFGNEGHGVSAQAVAEADGAFLLPMVGFPQSLNLSVSVATTVYGLRAKALEQDLPGDLSDQEQIATYDQWVRRHCGEIATPAGVPGVDKRGEVTEAFSAPG